MTDTSDRSSDRFDAFSVGIPDPEQFPHISVPAAAHLAGVARRTGYDAAQRGEWPVIRIGRAVRVCTRPFLQKYGLIEDELADQAQGTA